MDIYIYSTYVSHDFSHCIGNYIPLQYPNNYIIIPSLSQQWLYLSPMISHPIIGILLVMEDDIPDHIPYFLYFQPKFPIIFREYLHDWGARAASFALPWPWPSPSPWRPWRIAHGQPPTGRRRRDEVRCYGPTSRSWPDFWGNPRENGPFTDDLLVKMGNFHSYSYVTLPGNPCKICGKFVHALVQRAVNVTFCCSDAIQEKAGSRENNPKRSNQ